jgi:hypothetical protein
VYSKVKLKGSVDKASPCLRWLGAGDVSDNSQPLQTLLLLLFKHIVIGPTGFMGVLNSMRIQHFLPNWIVGFLEVCKWLMYCPILLTPPPSSNGQMQRIWSVFDLLHLNPYHWSLIILFAYGINLVKRMLDKQLIWYLPFPSCFQNFCKPIALLAAYFHAGFFAWLILRPWRWRRHVPPKRWLIFNGLHGVMSWKIELTVG